MRLLLLRLDAAGMGRRLGERWKRKRRGRESLLKELRLELGVSCKFVSFEVEKWIEMVSETSVLLLLLLHVEQIN